MATPMLAGDGTYSFEIVGEGRRQAELESICGEPGAAHDDVEQECLALLVPSASGPHEADEVRVEINGRYVGNLSRSDAAEYIEAIRRLGFRNRALACRALISGRWNGERGGDFSVGLDLDWPPRLAAAAGNQVGSASAGSGRRRRRRFGIAKALLAVTLLAAGVSFALWYLPPPGDAETESRTKFEREPSADRFLAPEQAEVAPAETAETAAAGNVCPDAETAARAWEIVRNSGVVTSASRSGDISVNEKLWAELPQDDKVRFAMASYCRSAQPDGSGAILVVGATDRQVKGSIIDGEWRDPVQR